MRTARIVCALALVLLLPACVSAGAGAAGDRDRQAVATVTVDSSTLQEQADWLKGSRAKLSPIPGAEKWLGSADFAAYRDDSGAELIYDRKHDRVLSWETEYRTVTQEDTHQPEGYDVPVGLAVKNADRKLRTKYTGDVDTMRKRVKFFDHGSGAQFDFTYQRYVNGVGVSDWGSVACSGMNGGAFKYVFATTQPYPKLDTYQVRLDLKTAATKAAEHLGLKEWRFVSASLHVVPAMASHESSGVLWYIDIDDATPLPPDTTRSCDHNGAFIDPLTGEVAGIGG